MGVPRRPGLRPPGAATDHRGPTSGLVASLLVITLVAGCSVGGDRPLREPGSGRPAATAPAPTPRPTSSATADDPVPPAAPVAISISAVGIDSGVEEYTDAQVSAAGGWVDPVHRDVVAWWSGGGAPGNPAENTVYLYGHVSARPAVFNGLAGAAVGDEVVLTTATGTLTYEVTAVLPPVPKSELPDVPEVAAVSPGRLVLIGCHREPDQGTRPTTQNTVVIAEQVASAAGTPDTGVRP